MAGNILGIFAALFLGVAAYFAWINKGEYEAQIDRRLDEEAGLKAAEDLLARTTGEREDAQANLDEWKAKFAEAEELLEEQLNKVAELQTEVEETEESIAEVKEEIKEKEEVLASVGDPDELIANVKEYKASIAEHEIAIAAEEAKKAGLESDIKNLVANIKATRDYIGLYSKQQSSPTLNTTIANIHPGFGYVTINGGDAAGVIKGSTLQVVRGNETIAKILVSSVEANIAAGDVIPGTLLPDTRVLPGDKVIADIANN